jgi:hypothetical protein
VKFKMYYLLPAVLSYFLGGCAGGCEQSQNPVATSSNASYPLAKSYIYNNNFDTASNVNEWQVQIANGGTASASLSTLFFLSAPNSLALVENDGAGSDIAMGFAYSGQGNLIFDSYQDFNNFPANSRGEFTFYSGGKRHLTLGVSQSSSTVSLYTYNGANPVTIDSSVNTATFHHITVLWHQSTDTSDYYIDGLLAAQAYPSNAYAWTTTPVSTYQVAFEVPTGALASGWTWYADNFSIGQ